MAVRFLSRYRIQCILGPGLVFILVHTFMITSQYPPQNFNEVKQKIDFTTRKASVRGSVTETSKTIHTSAETKAAPTFQSNFLKSVNAIQGKLEKEEEKNKGFVGKLLNHFQKEDGYLDIKPLVNMTLNAFGIFDDIDYEKPFDVKDTKRLFHSMFQIWSPQASNWASKASKSFRQYVNSLGEDGDESSVRSPELEERPSYIPECGCNRTILAEVSQLGKPSDSTCSHDSYRRGAGQKIIGFSFYGNPNSTKGKERKYFKGIEENLSLLPLHYPGWTIRVYYDLETDSPVLTSLCELACSNPSLDICHVRDNPAAGDISKIFAMNWRFFPTLDPQVDAFLSRDLDSRINSREKAAVAEWFNTKHHFHFMRDNPAHGIEILGSGWGVRLGPQNSKARSMMRETFRTASRDSMFWAARKAYGPDQGFLKRYVWPWAKWSAVTHDSYFCRQFARTSPFPTRRKNETNNFIAAVVEAGDTLTKPCPEICRPKEHRDWITC